MILIKDSTDLIIRRHCDFYHMFDTFSWDISQCQFYSQIRDKQGNLIGTFEIMHGGDSITLKLSKETTGDIPAGNYLFDILQVNESGITSVIIEGNAIVKPERTKLP